MKNLDEIHYFVDKIKNKTRFSYKYYIFGILMGLVFVLLLGMVFFNINIGGFSRKYEELKVLDKKIVVGNESDPQNSSNPAYEFWYAPPKSYTCPGKLNSRVYVPT